MDVGLPFNQWPLLPEWQDQVKSYDDKIFGLYHQEAMK